MEWKSRTRISAVCLLLALATGVEARGIEDLQGTWRGSSAERSGPSATEGRSRGTDVVVTFRGDQFLMTGVATQPLPSTPVLRRGAFQLDPTRDPERSTSCSRSSARILESSQRGRAGYRHAPQVGPPSPSARLSGSAKPTWGSTSSRETRSPS
jgi:hypothetical protein